MPALQPVSLPSPSILTEEGGVDTMSGKADFSVVAVVVDYR